MMDRTTTILELHNKIQRYRKDYREGLQDRTAAESKVISDAIYQMLAELAEKISDGAVGCKQCGAKPHGMLKRFIEEDGIAVFEVGCLTCEWKARGATPDLAVSRWNSV